MQFLFLLSTSFCHLFFYEYRNKSRLDQTKHVKEKLKPVYF